MRKTLFISLPIITLALILILLALFRKPFTPEFDGDIALENVATQLNFGPRTPGSQGHQQTLEWIESTLEETDWDVEIQQEDIGIYTVQNIIAKRENKNGPWIILAAHYDTRFFSDQDPLAENHEKAVPGANDGASGVAILLEMARTLPDSLDKNIWLVFFDAEDQGRIDGWDWILGSTSFVNQLSDVPNEVIIIDMVGDADLNLYYEENSDKILREEIWQVAQNLGYQSYFIPEVKYSILDDHIPFVNAGITAIDIIDFDYPYWHTQQDTLDKVSAKSLQIVGDTLTEWLILD